MTVKTINRHEAIRDGQVWRLDTIDGPAHIRIDDATLPLDYTVLDGPVHPRHARLRPEDLIDSPNASLCPTQTTGGSDGD